MTIIERLNEKLSTTGISVLRFSKESGIDSPKVYKWLDALKGKGSAKPKYEDAKKIEAWLDKLENKEPVAGIQISLEELYVMQAQITALRNQVVKLMASVQERPVDSCMDDLEQNADVILRDMLKRRLQA